jgi:tRNA (cmo5U34)-methyltransferase
VRKSWNDYDRISPYYDTLARVVFGKSIVASQQAYLGRITEESNVLVLGGGSGWIVESIMEAQPLCKVWFVESSIKMIQQAQRRLKKEWNVVIIHGDENDIPESVSFNFVISNFFLDLFKEDELRYLISHVKTRCASNVSWVATDFVREKVWHQFILKLMYQFFRITTNGRNLTLPDWNQSLTKSGFSLIESRGYYGGFIRANMLQLTSS